MLEPELFLPSEYSVYPTFLVCTGRVERSQRLGEPPEFAVSPDDRKLFIGPRLRRIRRELGQSQTQMAERLGISPSYG